MFDEPRYIALYILIKKEILFGDIIYNYYYLEMDDEDDQGRVVVVMVVVDDGDAFWLGLINDEDDKDDDEDDVVVVVVVVVVGAISSTKEWNCVLVEVLIFWTNSCPSPTSDLFDSPGKSMYSSSPLCLNPVFMGISSPTATTANLVDGTASR